MYSIFNKRIFINSSTGPLLLKCCSEGCDSKVIICNCVLICFGLTRPRFVFTCNIKLKCTLLYIIKLFFYMCSKLSRNCSQNVRRSAMNPDLIYLVDSSGLQKAFVLDNGRLQLEIVKHAFSLTSVELVISEYRSITCWVFKYFFRRYCPFLIEVIHLKTLNSVAYYRVFCS